MDKKYYIGLDIGTDSIGWAVTDENYNLLKARGEELWGSYLFDTANTAEDRRIYRTNRRRTARVHNRLMLLQELFAEEIAKIDETFFLRLNDSKLFVMDKDSRIRTKNVLFNDAGYTDKEYFARFPTIFHLRSALIDGEIKDIRLLYLAIHHILKNRGHFLFENRTFDASDKANVKQSFDKINSILSENENYSVLDLRNLDEILNILAQRNISKRDKQKELQELFSAGKNKQVSTIVNALTGYTVNFKDLYPCGPDTGDIKSFGFQKDSFDTLLLQIEKIYGDEAEFIKQLKAVYDWTVLCDILCGQQFISRAKVALYDKHKQDLARLKDYIRKNCPDKYKLTFRHIDDKHNYSGDKNNYAAYIGMDKKHGYSKCSKDEFYNFLKKEIRIDDAQILTEMETGEFMPKQVSNANGVIPYQVHLTELKAILKNAENYFPFLKQKSDGFTISDKIISLMTFRIPYYVGPLNDKSPFAWVKKFPDCERLKITPWNFDKVVDKDLSEQEFIRRMTNKCTYLLGEDVLPAASLIYSEFAFLNELNNLKINGTKNPEAKRLIYDYARKHKRVTLKNCLKILIDEGMLEKNSKTEDVFSGIDEDFKNSLSSYVDFYGIIGDKVVRYNEMCERIILWITLISDKQRLQKLIKKEFGDLLDDDEIKKIIKLNYSKWGRLSKKLLTEIFSPKCTDENGELLSILDVMRNSDDNFMQVLSDKYGFMREIERYNAENSPTDKITYRSVEDLYCSPAVKRAIWRSICLVREIIKIQKCNPDKIFIEMAREQKDSDNKGTRTVSRKQQILDLYKNIKGESKDWKNETESIPDRKFNSDKLLLYYRQMGRSMYSGKQIKLDEVFDTNICDIDHIYPQSKIKDDSLDNRVLVFKSENARKGDEYPLNSEIREKMTQFWKELKNKGLINEVKYLRLTRNTELTQTELTDFINRQLVETRQSTKAVAALLRRLLPDTSVVYAKAGNASDFKADNKLVKVRELNDLHHAKDAYINIVVGNVYDVKFCHNAEVFFKNFDLQSYNLKYLFCKDIPGAWKVADKERILNTARKDSCKIVRFVSEGKGALFNATIKTAGTNENLIPLKEKGSIADTSKYGGYDSASTAYFALVKSVGRKKDERLLSLEAIPILADKRCGGKANGLQKYCEENLGLIEPVVLISRIKLNTLFCIDGSYAYIRGKTGSRIIWCNANQLKIDNDSLLYLKSISNYFRDIKKLNKPDLEVSDSINAQKNLNLYDLFCEKLITKTYRGLNITNQAEMLKQKREEFEALSLNDQCRIIMEVLHLMQCNSTTANFKLLGGPARAGVILTGKFIQNSNIKMINQSPTGYYRNIIDFNDFK